MVVLKLVSRFFKEFLKFRPEIKTDKEFKEWNYMLDKRYIQAENELQVEFNYQPERDDNNDLMVPSENNFFDKPAENPLYKHNHEQDKQLYDGSGNMTGHYDTFLLRDALDETIHDARIIKNNGLCLCPGHQEKGNRDQCHEIQCIETLHGILG